MSIIGDFASIKKAMKGDHKTCTCEGHGYRYNRAEDKVEHCGRCLAGYRHREEYEKLRKKVDSEKKANE